MATMDLLNNLALGFGVAFTLQNLLYAFVGCVLGTLIGVLPGLGPGGDDRDAAAHRSTRSTRRRR